MRSALPVFIALTLWLSAPAGAAETPPPEFSYLRSQSQAAANKWDPAAQLFRVDLWGTYSNSIFHPYGGRFLFYSPKDQQAGLEVRIDSKGLKSFKYPLNFAAPVVAIPDKVLSDADAVRRLWDLAPTVHTNQVYIQLLEVGVEKPIWALTDNDSTSYPLDSFLHSFPVRLTDNEKTAPKDRLVWRMLAVRDHDVPADRAYGAFCYIDAITGQALSPRRPAVGVQVYQTMQLTPPSPIQPFVFPAGEIALTEAEQVGTFDPLAVAQKVEGMDLTLRLMVCNNRPDGEIRPAIDQMCNWWHRVEKNRRDDADHGLAVVEDAAKRNPNDLPAQVHLLKRYVDLLALEKKEALGSAKVQMSTSGPRSLFWFERTFELNTECLGTRNQTHVVLDEQTGEWLYRLGDPQNSGRFSHYARPAAQLIRTLTAGGKEDPEVHRQQTRYRWLIGGNGAAITWQETVDPLDPLQMACWAEYNRVVGSDSLQASAQLRAPKYWSTADVIGNTRIVTTWSRPATPEEVAAADRMDAVLKQTTGVQINQMYDLAFKLPMQDPLVYYLWARVEGTYMRQELANRVLMHGLMIDPGNLQLHATRLVQWRKNNAINESECAIVHKLGKPCTPDDLQGGAHLPDPFAGYLLSLQRLRLDPETVGSHAILAESLLRMPGESFNGEEPLPDAVEQAQRELGVAAAMMYRLLDRPDDWHYGVAGGGQAVTRQTLVNNLVTLLNLRAKTLQSLGQTAAAQACSEKARQLGAAPTDNTR